MRVGVGVGGLVGEQHMIVQQLAPLWMHRLHYDTMSVTCTSILNTTRLQLWSSSSSLLTGLTWLQFPYHLHAVLVHEGQAASGHYWAFVYDQSRSLWLKFNDITVSESSWEELERESVGGYHNASAYCLMYVDRARIQDCAGACCLGGRSFFCVHMLVVSLPACFSLCCSDQNLWFWGKEGLKSSI